MVSNLKKRNAKKNSCNNANNSFITGINADSICKKNRETDFLKNLINDIDRLELNTKPGVVYSLYGSVHTDKKISTNKTKIKLIDKNASMDLKEMKNIFSRKYNKKRYLFVGQN